MISDQSPRGACSDETMTADAEETAALAANEAVSERIIDGGKGRVPRRDCQAEREERRAGWNKRESGLL